MTTENTIATHSLQAETQRIIDDLRTAITTTDQHWFLALLDAIRAWPLPEERLNGRTYRYLIAGEAFDWLLLAERLCDEIEDLIPDDERQDLLFHGKLPDELDERDFDKLLGAKHRAHLNFTYGVRIETALQLAILDEVHKEHQSRVWDNGHADDETFTRIYGATRAQLFAEFENPPDLDEDLGPARPEVSKERTEHNGTTARGSGSQPDTNGASTHTLSLADLNEFTYWLFKRRVNGAEPARVASDTRKGLAHFQRLESRRRA